MVDKGGLSSILQLHPSRRRLLFGAIRQWWVDKNFDWTTWGNASKFVEAPEHVTVADESTIRKLFTTHLRQERFCEGHLAAMFENGHMVALLQRLRELSDDDAIFPQEIVVVAARNAWPEYQEIHAYVCQPNRKFQSVDRVAFYSMGSIQPLVPRILECSDDVTMTHDPRKQLPEGSPPSIAIERLVARLLAERRRGEGEKFKIMILSAPDSPDTLKIPSPITNDLISDAGKPIAYTRGHRYVAWDKLKVAKKTSEL